MAKVPEYYSVKETERPIKKRIYHDDDPCRVARDIPQSERRNIEELDLKYTRAKPTFSFLHEGTIGFLNDAMVVFQGVGRHGRLRAVPGMH